MLFRSWEHIAFTNVIKCNNSDKQDTATPDMKTNCMDKLGVIWQEIETLKPKAVIFYTGWDYDDHISRFTFGDCFRDISDRTEKRPNGKKIIGWWERDFFVKETVVLRFLRTSHPERQEKQGFVEKIVQWIRGCPY